MIAAIILFTFQILYLGINIAKHGEYKAPERYNSVVAFFLVLLNLALFYFAGVFDVFMK